VNYGIVGSRDYPDLEAVWNFVLALPDSAVVVSGGARGVDKTAEDAADYRGLRKVIHRADWDANPRGAGYERNPDIVRDSERLVAFLGPCTNKRCLAAKKCPCDGWSHGTTNTIGLARKAGIPTTVFTPDLRNTPRVFG
jgi:hypothetical protein